MNINEKVTFNYSGQVVPFVVPDSGVYKLECWGAGGGYYFNSNGTNGSKGGHSVGYATLNKGTTIYICVGGKGSNSNGGDTAGHSKDTVTAGGYNGGGAGHNAASGGGGATHISKVDGVLNEIGYESFVTNNNGLIVAGGGGGEGGYARGSANDSFCGGNGGGLSANSHGTSDTDSLGGTQSGGNAFGLGGTITAAQWPYGYHIGGGGGGLYGGYTKSNAGAGGGSGYIGGVPAIIHKGIEYTPLTENGIRSGDGLAEITFIAKNFPTIKIGNTTITDAKIGTAQIKNIYLGSNPLA